ncbi:MAG: hypothetical protein LBR05_11605 [Azoarcus sp.]|jgi:hypothetical protein|nr:hypothetical protein [Azoarcus sp.]
MTRKILLDSDYLISAFDSGQVGEVDRKRREVVEKLAGDPDTRFRITPLIFYEALRNCANPEVMEKKLNDLGFKYLEVSEAHGRRAAAAFRFAVNQNQGTRPDWLDKRSFDLFHCVCEEANEVELISGNVDDVPRLKQLLFDSRHPQNA